MMINEVIGKVFEDRGFNLEEEDVNDIVEELSSKSEEYINNNYVTTTEYKRVAADYDNMSKRLLKNQELSMDRWKNTFFEKLVELIDDFDFAIAKSNEEGIGILRDKFVTTLRSYNIEIDRPIGESFNAETQECVFTVKKDTIEKGLVVDCINNGAYINTDEGKKYIRYAKVVVAE